jgi:uncharacterized Fe-S cluster protein YjdI
LQMDKKDIVKKYQNDDLIVYWIPQKCTHAGACWKGLPEVFKPMERPWIKIEGATAEQIIATIDKCPTDALKYALPEGSKVNSALVKGSGAADLKELK